MSHYKTSGELSHKDLESNEFKIMVIQDDKLDCWTMYYDVFHNKLLKKGDKIDSDVLYIDESQDGDDKETESLPA